MPHLHLRWSYFAAGHPVLLFNTVSVKLRRSQNFATKGNDIVDLVVAHGGQITFWSISFFAFTFSLFLNICSIRSLSYCGRQLGADRGKFAANQRRIWPILPLNSPLDQLPEAHNIEKNRRATATAMSPNLSDHIKTKGMQVHGPLIEDLYSLRPESIPSQRGKRKFLPIFQTRMRNILSLETVLLIFFQSCSIISSAKCFSFRRHV